MKCWYGTGKSTGVCSSPPSISGPVRSSELWKKYIHCISIRSLLKYWNVHVGSQKADCTDIWLFISIMYMSMAITRVLHKILYEKALPWGINPYPLVQHFDRKDTYTPFINLYWKKVPLSHTFVSGLYYEKNCQKRKSSCQFHVHVAPNKWYDAATRPSVWNTLMYM